MNRRQALRTLAAGGATGVLAAGAFVASASAEMTTITPVAEMVGRLRALYDLPTPATDEQAETEYQVFLDLQTRIIRATPQTPNDVALQFMADTHWGDAGMSDEFSDCLRAMAGMDTTGETLGVDLEGDTAPDPMRQAVEEYEAAYALQGELAAAEDWAKCEAIYAARIGPAENAIGSGLPATTLAGAVGAVRYVASQRDWLEEAHLTALGSALAYFDGRA